MITVEEIFLDCIEAPSRQIKGRVELYEGSTPLDTYTAGDNLVSFSIERVGEDNKFFGYGICQKLVVNLLDRERTIEVDKQHSLEAVFGVDNHYIYTNPVFRVQSVKRNEMTNELTIEAFDDIYSAANYTVSELELGSAYSMKSFANAIAAKLGLPLKIVGEIAEFNIIYNNGANFEGTESLRVALDAMAEATQTIYYIDNDWNLTFKRLDNSGAAIYDIDKSKYFTLENKGTYTLSGIQHTTELGDNYFAGTQDNCVQFVRDNPFLELREDLQELLDTAITNVGGTTINDFTCTWRGNYLLEIGDKITITTKDGNSITTYLLQDTIKYNGGMQETSSWKYEKTDSETNETPSSIGDAIKQTYAKVDKANKEIEMVVSQTQNNAQELASLRLNTNSINATVQKVVQDTDKTFNSLNDDILTLNSRVDASMTPENVVIAIQSELSNGIDKVATKTGFTFDEVGLTITKTGTEMETTITEDGMIVYRDDTPVLTANNQGVDAVNLHASTYLIVGNKSRFESYGLNRTGCFWIGE